MLADRFLPAFSRRRSTAEIVVVSIAIAALAVRALEMPATPVALLRILLSAGAIAFVYMAPYKSFARRALTVLACEALLGTVMFVLIDVPFVFEHQQQIGMFAVSIADRVDRFEHGGELRR